MEPVNGTGPDRHWRNPRSVSCWKKRESAACLWNRLLLMEITIDGFKDRQLHMEDYLQMVSAGQKEYAEVSVYQRITENNDIPVRRVEIPREEKGKVRKLGISTVVDRLIQQAIPQELTPLFEPRFSENSYGFRPGRSQANGSFFTDL